MDIDVIIGQSSLSFNIENPHRMDATRIAHEIIDFGKQRSFDLEIFDVERLIRRMVRGVAGCENGCPADAKSLVREGFGDFRISYIEGGILSAIKSLGDGVAIELKVFPDFTD
jgi:hypothetical protein